MKLIMSSRVKKLMRLYGVDEVMAALAAEGTPVELVWVWSGVSAKQEPGVDELITAAEARLRKT
jgi:hypothetical protein